MKTSNRIKRVFALFITLIIAIGLFGCGETNTTKAVANSLEKSADRLSNIVSSLEEVNYDDIVIGDISPFGNSVSIKSRINTENSTIEKAKNFNRGLNKNVDYNTSNVSKKSKDVLTRNKSYVVGSRNRQNNAAISSNAKPDKKATFVSAESEKIGITD